MFKRKTSPIDTARTFLGALRRDARGNTMAILAAALIPLAGMVGGGIDISRMYIVKTRLQHACDAGALAGRKQMGAGSWGTDDNAAATRFFDANFQSDAYGITSRSRIFTENAGRVTGSASANLPMTLTRIIGRNAETLTVTCDAEMKLPNTDVMFVLDTTGSMNCVAGDLTCTNNGGVPASGSKIDGLKTAVKCFYEILAQLDTNANCTTGTPSGGTSSAVQIRFGFVPYSSNVNVGHLLRSDWISDSWNYQTRKRSGTGTAWSDPHTIYVEYGDSKYPTSTSCPNGYNSSTETWASGQWFRSGSVYYCQRVNYSFKGPNWNYGSLPVNSSALKSGTGWVMGYTFNTSINDDGSSRTINWDGCVEERANWGSSPATFTALPTVNDISQRPTTTDADTMWHPMLPDLVFYRNRFDQNGSWGGVTTATSTTSNRYYNIASYSCPTEVKLLQQWPDANVFDTYVDSLQAVGNTYHDIGMLWGARLMWPGGILDRSSITGPNGTPYASNTAANNGGAIQHHMIFMTDGDSTSAPCDYNSNGIAWFDRRQTNNVGNAADCGTNASKGNSNQELVDQINNRLATLCTLVKNKGITLWVVSYGGTGINSDTKDRLTACASPADSVSSTHYFDADDPTKLQQAFATIANNISQLRLTR